MRPVAVYLCTHTSLTHENCVQTRHIVCVLCVYMVDQRLGISLELEPPLG